MATASSTSTKGKSGGSGSTKVGRSSATGRFVLAPAGKGGRITIADARLAAKSIQNTKK